MDGRVRKNKKRSQKKRKLFLMENVSIRSRMGLDKHKRANGQPKEVEGFDYRSNETSKGVQKANETGQVTRPSWKETLAPYRRKKSSHASKKTFVRNASRRGGYMRMYIKRKQRKRRKNNFAAGNFRKTSIRKAR